MGGQGDGTDREVIAESLVIIDKVLQWEGTTEFSGTGASGKALLAPASGRSDLAEWKSRFAPAFEALVRPRIKNMPVKDYAEAEDLAYYQNKYESRGLDFEDALKRTPEHLLAMKGLLVELESLFENHAVLSFPLPSGAKWGMDDLQVLPDLRNLTCVKGVTWPSKIREYLTTQRQAAGIDDYSQWAC